MSAPSFQPFVVLLYILNLDMKNDSWLKIFKIIKCFSWQHETMTANRELSKTVINIIGFYPKYAPSQHRLEEHRDGDILIDLNCLLSLRKDRITRSFQSSTLENQK